MSRRKLKKPLTLNHVIPKLSVKGEQGGRNVGAPCKDYHYYTATYTNMPTR